MMIHVASGGCGLKLKFISHLQPPDALFDQGRIFTISFDRLHLILLKKLP